LPAFGTGQADLLRAPGIGNFGDRAVDSSRRRKDASVSLIALELIVDVTRIIWRTAWEHKEVGYLGDLASCSREKRIG
jgi:hypothetical protein